MDQGYIAAANAEKNKKTKDKEGRPILVLPPTDIQIIECEHSEAERDFYDALFKRSKVSLSSKCFFDLVIFCLTPEMHCHVVE